MTMLKNYQGTYDAKRCIADGCSCHNSKGLKRKWKHGAKRQETKRWQKDMTSS